VTEKTLQTTDDPWIHGKRTGAAISSVMVMEDRALITRRCRVELPQGESLLAVVPVTPLVADRTVRCRLKSQDGEEDARILDVGVRRHYRVRASRPEKERELTDSIEKLQDEYRADYDWALAGFHRLGLIGTCLNGLQRQINDRLAVAPFDDRWPAEVDQLFDNRSAVERELVQVMSEQEERRRRLRRLEDERMLALKPATEYQAGVALTVRTSKQGAFDLELEYQVACALWRPAYTAELKGEEGSQRTNFSAAGMVWQATGEDWNDVELGFSTERPAQGAELPLLVDDLLESREKTDKEKEVIEVASRDEAIQTVTDAPGEDLLSDTPPGLDDGGETRTYRVPGRVTVPTDGRPHRIEFERWEAEADCGYVALPELASYAFLRSVQENPSTLPLLAGPVALIRHGGYVGRSQIKYVSPKDRFALPWGSEDGLVVQRRRSVEFTETGLRKKKTYRFEVEVFLSNLTGAPRVLEVTERVPVSEIKQVEVKLDEKETSRGYKQDDQGLMRFELPLAPGADQKLSVVYTVHMPHNVHWNPS
jgi:uncharacterized protein (TIGR02231 family)